MCVSVDFNGGLFIFCDSLPKPEGLPRHVFEVDAEADGKEEVGSLPLYMIYDETIAFVIRSCYNSLFSK